MLLVTMLLAIDTFVKEVLIKQLNKELKVSFLY